MRRAFRFLFALWALLGVTISLLVVTPIYALIFVLGGRRAGPAAHKVSRVWASYILFICAIRVKVIGREKLDPQQTYIFISNHRSMLDIPLCARTNSHFFRFLAKAELGKVPLLGYIIRNLYITVSRASLRDRVAAMNRMKTALNEGASIWLYPEGTRNKTDQPLADFEDGAFQLALMTGIPLAVATIIDTGRHLPSGELFQLAPGTVRVWWEEPIPTTGLTKADLPALKEKVRRLMLRHFEKGS